MSDRVLRSQATHLVDLPNDVLDLIVGLCLPSECIFLVSFMGYKLRKGAGSVSNWPTLPWRSGGPGPYNDLPRNALALFRVHSVLSSYAVRRFYSTNTLSFTTLGILEHYQRGIRPQVKAAMRKIEIYACGGIYDRTLHGNERRWSFTQTFIRYQHDPQPKVADLVSKFPNLQECRLIGIGPSDEVSVRLHAKDWRMACRFWRLDCIDLVANIVRVTVDDQINATESSKKRKREYRKEPVKSMTKEAVARATPGPLAGGTVLCIQQSEKRPRWDQPGDQRSFGTRIVSCDTRLQAREDEVVVDVPCVLANAKKMAKRQAPKEMEHSYPNLQYYDIPPATIPFFIEWRDDWSSDSTQQA